MRVYIARFAIAASMMVATGCQSGGPSKFATNWWPWGQKKYDTSAVASTKTPGLPAANATPATTTGRHDPYASWPTTSGGLASPAGTSTSGTYPDFSGQAAYAGNPSGAQPAAYGAPATGGYGAHGYPSTAGAAGGYAQSGSAYGQSNNQYGYGQTGTAATTSPSTDAYGGYAPPPYGGAAGGAATSPQTTAGVGSRYGNYEQAGTGAAASGAVQTADQRYGAAGSATRYEGYNSGSDARYPSNQPSDAGSRYGDASLNRYGASLGGSLTADPRYAPSTSTQGAPNFGAGAADPSTAYPSDSSASRSSYQPGQTDYRPGETGYLPAGVPPYQMPASPYTSNPSATSDRRDPHYRPGSTSDYLPNSGTPSGSSMPTGQYPSTSGAAPFPGTQPALLTPGNNPLGTNPLGTSQQGTIPQGASTMNRSAPIYPSTQPSSTATAPPAVSYGNTGY